MESQYYISIKYTPSSMQSKSCYFSPTTIFNECLVLYLTFPLWGKSLNGIWFCKKNPKTEFVKQFKKWNYSSKQKSLEFFRQPRSKGVGMKRRNRRSKKERDSKIMGSWVSCRVERGLHELVRTEMVKFWYLLKNYYYSPSEVTITSSHLH